MAHEVWKKVVAGWHVGGAPMAKDELPWQVGPCDCSASEDHYEIPLSVTAEEVSSWLR